MGSVSPISNSLQITLDNLQEALLQVGIVADEKLMALAAKNPAVLKQLQDALSLISNQFSNVIQNKYNESPQTIINNLSPAQVNALKSQITPIQAQINSLTSDLSVQNANLTTQQAALSAASNNVTTLTGQQTALTAQVATDQGVVNGYFGTPPTGSTPGQNGSILNTVIQNAAIFGNDSDGEYSGAIANFKSAQAAEFAQGLQPTSNDITTLIGELPADTTAEQNFEDQLFNQLATANSAVNNLDNDQASLANVTSQIPAAQAAVTAAQAQVNATMANITSDTNSINTETIQLNGLNAQLAAAEAGFNTGLSFYNALSPLEKNMFKELYPNITFPS
jgi:chromosome segregation ATPase